MPTTLPIKKLIRPIRFGFFVMVIVTSIWLIHSGPATAQYLPLQQESKPAASSLPKPKFSPTPNRCCANEGKQLIYAPLVELPESSGTEINLNCRSPRIVDVTPTFFTQQGEAFVGTTFQMQPTEVKTVDLRTLMPAGVRGRKDLGGMTLEYMGGTFEMWAQLRLMKVNRGNSVDMVFSILQDQRSTFRNAVWWMPAGGGAAIAIGNFGNSLLKARASFANGDSEDLEVPPFGTHMIKRKGTSQRSNSEGNAEAVTIEAFGTSTNIIAAGAVTSRDGSFTSSIRFYDTRFVAQPNLYATNFRLKDVKPSLVLRNTGTETIMATPRFIAALGSPDNFIDLATVTLAPNEVKNVDLEPLNSAVSGKPEFNHVSVQVLNNGKPGSLIGALNGNDSIKKMTYDVPLRDIGAMRNSTGAYPWRVDHDLSTVVSITNVSTLPSRVVVQINYSGGHYLLDPRPLAAGETAVYDLRRIRDEQIPDRTGSPLPRSVKDGQFKWFIYGGGSGRLIGRAEMLSQSQGISSSYSCPGGNCPPEFSYAFFDNSEPFIGVGGTSHVQVFEIDCDAYGCIGPFIPPVDSWGQSNPLVVTLVVGNNSNADLIGITGGVTDFWANVGHDRWGWDGLACYWLGWFIDGAQGTATVPKLDINFNGNTNGTHDVIVGQQVNLTTTPFPGNATVTDSQWTVAGGNSDRIANYVVNFTNSSGPTSATVTNLSSLNGTSVSFYWISEGNGRTVEYSAKINGRNVSRTITFNVKRPTASIAATASTTNIGVDSVTQNTELRLGNPDATPGITFTRSLTLPQGFSGDTQWVQIFTQKSGTVTINGQTASLTTVGLDDVYPYPLDSNATAGNGKTSDTPGFVLNSLTSASVDFRATMCLMFKPSNVQGTSIWVPLRQVSWVWQASATLNNSIWSITSQANPGTLSDANSTAHPVWTKNANTP